jgi:hypothetical protein
LRHSIRPETIAPLASPEAFAAIPDMKTDDPRACFNPASGGWFHKMQLQLIRNKDSVHNDRQFG